MIGLLLGLCRLAEGWSFRNATCFYDSTKANPYSVVYDVVEETGVAWAVYNHSLSEDGWYKLHVHSNDTYDDKVIMHCAGMVEGFLTHRGMFDHFNLLKDIQGWERGHYYPEDVHDFIDANRIYTKDSVEAFVEDEWWQGIGLILEQFEGLVEGYNAGIEAAGLQDHKLSLFEHWFFQSAGDMFDIAEKFEGSVADTDYSEDVHEHCTGMVKLTDDYSDIFFAHDAWSDFRELHGELKEYDLKIKKFNAKKIVMSTRVGKLSSYDDYYVADSGLFVLETTMNNYNMELYYLDGKEWQ